MKTNLLLNTALIIYFIAFNPQKNDLGGAELWPIDLSNV